MNREEILSAAQKKNGEMDERVSQQYRLSYVIGAGASITLCSIFSMLEVLRDGNWFGYTSIVMMQMGISGLIFGIRAKDTSIGKLYLVAGVICSIACIFNIVLYFLKGQGMG